MNTFKPWYTSYTIWYGIIIGFIGILGVFANQYPGIASFALLNGILVVALRTYNTTIIASPSIPPVIPTDTTPQ